MTRSDDDLDVGDVPEELSLSDFPDDDVRSSVLRRARTEGLAVAYETALELCREKSTPGQTRAVMTRTILEIGGLLDFRDRASSSNRKQPHEMDGKELEEAVAEVQARMAGKGARPTKRRKKGGGVLD
jgi:hypothetical protein